MDSAQIILVVVIILLTILLFVLGVQVFFILKEFRKTVSKANRVLDNTNAITQNVSDPINSIARLASGLKTGASIINVFKKLVSGDDEDSGKKNRKD